MVKYRIVKETKSKTKTVRYYVEKYNEFLLWHWWTKLKTYDPLCSTTFVLDFDTLKKAKKECDLRTEHIITEIINYH